MRDGPDTNASGDAAEGADRDRFSLHHSTVPGSLRALTQEATLQPLNPREIQARVRAGDSPEVVAAEYGWPLDRVVRYAEPLLGERAYIAGLARSVEIRRSRGGATLEETALSVIRTEDPDALTWDAYKDTEGRWIVTAVMGSSTATWTYDTTGRSVHPIDAGAKKLMGVEADTEEALDMIAERPVEPTDTVVIEHPVHAERPRLVAVPEPESESDDDPSAHVRREQDAPAQEPDHLDLDVPPATTGSTSAPSPAAKKSKPKRGRASIPSWDEILFGATKSPRDE